MEIGTRSAPAFLRELANAMESPGWLRPALPENFVPIGDGDARPRPAPNETFWAIHGYTGQLIIVIEGDEVVRVKKPMKVIGYSIEKKENHG